MFEVYENRIGKPLTNDPISQNPKTKKTRKNIMSAKPKNPQEIDYSFNSFNVEDRIDDFYDEVFNIHSEQKFLNSHNLQNEPIMALPPTLDFQPKEKPQKNPQPYKPKQNPPSRERPPNIFIFKGNLPNLNAHKNLQESSSKIANKGHNRRTSNPSSIKLVKHNIDRQKSPVFLTKKPQKVKCGLAPNGGPTVAAITNIDDKKRSAPNFRRPGDNVMIFDAVDSGDGHKLLQNKTNEVSMRGTLRNQ
jgi:hypothetical protein